MQFQNLVNELIKNIIIFSEDIFPGDGGQVYEKYISRDSIDLEADVGDAPYEVHGDGDSEPGQSEDGKMSGGEGDMEACCFFFFFFSFLFFSKIVILLLPWLISPTVSENMTAFSWFHPNWNDRSILASFIFFLTFLHGLTDFVFLIFFPFIVYIVSIQFWVCYCCFCMIFFHYFLKIVDFSKGEISNVNGEWYLLNHFLQ